MIKLKKNAMINGINTELTALYTRINEFFVKSCKKYNPIIVIVIKDTINK